MPGPHDFAVRSDLAKRIDRPCAACRSFGEGVEAPFVCAPVNRSRETRPAIADRARRCRVHRIPYPTFVTMANAPLFGTGWRELVEMICPTSKAKNISREGWTGNSLICPSGKSVADCPVPAVRKLEQQRHLPSINHVEQCLRFECKLTSL